MTNPPNYTVGDKVVCIDDSPVECPKGFCKGRPPTFEMPKRGQLYVVRAIWISALLPRYLVQFVGFPDVLTKERRLKGFAAERFRKLEDIQSENAAKVSNTQNA